MKKTISCLILVLIALMCMASVWAGDAGNYSCETNMSAADEEISVDESDCAIADSVDVCANSQNSPVNARVGLASSSQDAELLGGTFLKDNVNSGEYRYYPEIEQDDNDRYINIPGHNYDVEVSCMCLKDNPKTYSFFVKLMDKDGQPQVNKLLKISAFNRKSFGVFYLNIADGVTDDEGNVRIDVPVNNFKGPYGKNGNPGMDFYYVISIGNIWEHHFIYCVPLDTLNTPLIQIYDRDYELKVNDVNCDGKYYTISGVLEDNDHHGQANKTLRIDAYNRNMEGTHYMNLGKVVTDENGNYKINISVSHLNGNPYEDYSYAVALENYGFLFNVDFYASDIAQKTFEVLLKYLGFGWLIGGGN